ncbi:MAG: YjbQ family protein [Ignisphaera sp.]
MKVCSKIVEIRTYGPMVLHPITYLVKDVISECKASMGLVWISVEGATPALIVLSKGMDKDFLNFICRFIPFNGWRHGNAYAHLISTLISTNIVIPIMDGSLVLSPDDDIYLLETRSVHNHVRRISIQIHTV